jgi:hypothetical protein
MITYVLRLIMALCRFKKQVQFGNREPRNKSPLSLGFVFVQPLSGAENSPGCPPANQNQNFFGNEEDLQQLNKEEHKREMGGRRRVFLSWVYAPWPLREDPMILSTKLL